MHGHVVLMILSRNDLMTDRCKLSGEIRKRHSIEKYRQDAKRHEKRKL